MASKMKPHLTIQKTNPVPDHDRNYDAHTINLHLVTLQRDTIQLATFQLSTPTTHHYDNLSLWPVATDHSDNSSL
jgi:hypothetical protein